MGHSPSRPVVRLAEEADAEAIAEIVADALRDKYRPALGAAAERGIAALVRRDLRSVATSRHWVAELDGRVAGAVHLVLDHEPDADFAAALAPAVGWALAIRATLVLGMIARGRMAPDEAYIDELAVAGWARRRGVARALLAACEEEGRRSGRARMTLWVTIDNAAARPLYEGAGFREARRRRWLVGRLIFRSPGAILMERRLSPPR
jgi:ribosomal protein S18 acetylase RimI-like enzyme